ncbi:hypothetical protein [Desulfovibrio sp. JC010]|uniref:hypothetical protein n=1 Tax=Desulfovibrio sp. JC010 TaxID=2593641 RepID=UPI0013CFFC3D|nr:hypothetical protein [Desulfovibrio sp. JC010]NDV28696.1 hypothetical protein [Desulfovibrio sp. JC010]
MKNILSILALLVILVIPAQASASYYYTLEGTVGSISDGGGLASAAGISVGDTVRYVIEIDTDRTGFYTKNNGKNKDVKGSYYSSLYSGTLNGMTTRNYNYLNPHNGGFYSQTGNEQTYLEISNWSSGFGDLTIGSTVNQIFEAAFNENWGYTQIATSNLKITNISNVAPTPIPGAAFIMLGGLGVVGVVRRKFF